MLEYLHSRLSGVVIECLDFAEFRLTPWLGHLVVSRQETARRLLTPGEVMQLPPSDEIVMVAGTPPTVAPATADYRPPHPQIAFHLEPFIEQVRANPADPIIVRQNWLRAYPREADAPGHRHQDGRAPPTGALT